MPVFWHWTRTFQNGFVGIALLHAQDKVNSHMIVSSLTHGYWLKISIIRGFVLLRHARTNHVWRDFPVSRLGN